MCAGYHHRTQLLAALHVKKRGGQTAKLISEDSVALSSNRQSFPPARGKALERRPVGFQSLMQRPFRRGRCGSNGSHPFTIEVGLRGAPRRNKRSIRAPRKGVTSGSAGSPKRFVNASHK